MPVRSLDLRAIVNVDRAEIGDSGMKTPSADSTTAGFAHLDQARSVRIETPEHVRLGFELAGLGSRSAAVIADYLLLLTASVVILLVVARFGDLTGDGWIANLGASAGIFFVFGIQWGYFFIAEGFFGGRTFGKRSLGLRVIGADGTPITLPSAALRNLIRIVDLQPVGSSIVGLGLIALHPRAQRLGDIVAGTVVVRDRGEHEIPEHRAADTPTRRSRIDARRFDVLERYIQRRDSLSHGVRLRLTGQIAKAMGPPIARHPRRTTTPLEELLDELYEEEKPLQSYALGTSAQAVQLVRSQRGAWERCKELVDKAGRRGLTSLSEGELQEFTTLYREVVADLARAHAYGGSLRLCFHLERLVGEAHNLFYRGRRSGFSATEWLRSGFPRSFRRHRVLVAVAAALLFVPAFVTYAGVRSDPELGRRFLPPQIVTRAEEAGDRLRAGDQYVDIPPVQMSLFSSQVMTNNLGVAFTAAAGGMLAGLGTLFILIFNGVNLGSVFALYDAHGAGSILWVFVLSHGVLELTAIVVSGAAGLLLARAIIAPGRRTRGQALREDGREALSLVGGAGVLLVMAGLVEGFVSPAQIPTPLKLSFAGALAFLLALYLSGLTERGDDVA